VDGSEVVGVVGKAHGQALCAFWPPSARRPFLAGLLSRSPAACASPTERLPARVAVRGPARHGAAQSPTRPAL